MNAEPSTLIPPEEIADGESWQAELGGIRLLFGAGRLAELGELARELDGARALLVTDPGLRRAAHVDRAERALAGAGLEIRVFDGVVPDPDSRIVDAGAAVAESFGPDLIVGLGGGSSLDAAKGINFVHTNGGRMEDYWGFGRAKRPLLPMIGVPTTAGTGSDAQSYALIGHRDNGRKMACGDRGARFRAVILDPELMASVPGKTAAIAGIDALSHACESYVCRVRNPVSELLAREAWRRLVTDLPALLGGRGSLDTHGKMLFAAHLAGAAIETSMLGAAHASANPLTARFGVIHGVAVGLMLPHVVRLNAGLVDDLYATLEAGGGNAVAARVESLRLAAGLPGRLRDVGVDRTDLPALSASATLEWTAGFNPRPLDERDFLDLYEAAF